MSTHADCEQSLCELQAVNDSKRRLLRPVPCASTTDGTKCDLCFIASIFSPKLDKWKKNCHVGHERQLHQRQGFNDVSSARFNLKRAKYRSLVRLCANELLHVLQWDNHWRRLCVHFTNMKTHSYV